jgi:hypothetical protein
MRISTLYLTVGAILLVVTGIPLYMRFSRDFVSPTDTLLLLLGAVGGLVLLVLGGIRRRSEK